MSGERETPAAVTKAKFSGKNNLKKQKTFDWEASGWQPHHVSAISASKSSLTYSGLVAQLETLTDLENPTGKENYDMNKNQGMS